MAGFGGAYSGDNEGVGVKSYLPVLALGCRVKKGEGRLFALSFFMLLLFSDSMRQLFCGTIP